MNIRVDALRFERDGRTVLDIPSLLVHGDRTTAILGPNGAGKTTLLRLIAGLEHPDSGRIQIGDGVVRRGRQDIAYVFQEQVFLTQPVRENLALGLRLRGIARDERQQRVDDAARMLGITHLLDRRADRLSGGEARRVSIARALCLRAPVALLDEPLAGLDPATYVRLLDELPRVLVAFGSTILLVTHDHREAFRLADDLIVIVAGRVHAAGTKKDVATNPPSAPVAEILGYVVVDFQGNKVGIRPEVLKPGTGVVNFCMTVDAVVDVVGHHDVLGVIGPTRLRVPLPPGAALPRPGDLLPVHTEYVVPIGTSSRS
jgi:ABC-type sugar transport system ATPase subunit